MDDTEIQRQAEELIADIDEQINETVRSAQILGIYPSEMKDNNGVGILTPLLQAKATALLTLSLSTDNPEKPAPVFIQNLYGPGSEVDAAEIYRQTKNLLSQTEIEAINKRRRGAVSPDIPEVQRAVEDRVGNQLQAYPLLKEFYKLFREAVLKAEVAVSEENSIKMNVLDDLIRE